MFKKALAGFLVFLFWALAFIIAFTAYFFTASKYLQPGDSTEMVTAAVTLGIPHQPGYPLNTFIGHFLYKADVLELNAVQRVNLASALIQSLTVSVFYFLMLSIFKYKDMESRQKLHEEKDLNAESGKSPDINEILSAFTSSLFLAFSLIFWQYATKFEVFPLNNLFAVLIFLLAFRIVAGAPSDKKRGDIVRFVYIILLAFILGLAVTHHQTILLILPSLFIVLWPYIRELITAIKDKNKEKILRIKIVSGLSLLAFFTGFSLYFILILRLSATPASFNNSYAVDLVTSLKSLARDDFGFLSPFLKTEGTVKSNFGMDQIVYFLKSIYSDFTLYGSVFFVVGIVSLLKKYRKQMIFILSGIFFAGFLFLAYANFPITGAFEISTLRRFYLLPDIFIAVTIGLGIKFIMDWISATPGKQPSSFGLTLLKAIISVSFLLPLYINFLKADIKNNDFLEQYLNGAFNSIPDGSLVMVSGDIQNMSADYYRLIEAKDKNLVFLSPGRFYSSYYLDNLIRNNPRLTVPPPQGGRMFTTVSQIAQENIGKFNIFISQDLPDKDPEIKKNFVLYPKNLLYQVKAIGEDEKLEDWKKDNENIFKIVSERTAYIKKRSPMFDNLILYYYARYFYLTGDVLNQVGLFEEAIDMFNKSIAVEPMLADTYKGLSEAYAQKAEPDYYSAYNYLLSYRNMIFQYDSDSALKAEKQLEKYRNQLEEAYKKQEEEQKQEATTSGGTKEASEEGQLIPK